MNANDDFFYSAKLLSSNKCKTYVGEFGPVDCVSNYPSRSEPVFISSNQF